MEREQPYLTSTDLQVHHSMDWLWLLVQQLKRTVAHYGTVFSWRLFNKHEGREWLNWQIQDKNENICRKEKKRNISEGFINRNQNPTTTSRGSWTLSHRDFHFVCQRPASSHKARLKTWESIRVETYPGIDKQKLSRSRGGWLGLQMRILEISATQRRSSWASILPLLCWIRLSAKVSNF